MHQTEDEYSKNGILLGSSNSNTALSQWNNPKLAVLGNSIYADVDIAEVIFYQGALNDAQRIIIEKLPWRKNMALHWREMIIIPTQVVIAFSFPVSEMTAETLVKLETHRDYILKIEIPA